MNMIMKFEDYNKNNVFFQDPIANTIFDNSHFIRINYSNHLFMLNCIILEFNLSLQNIENYFNKYKYTYNVKTNIIPITSLIKLEKEILDKLSIKNKKPLFNLNQQLMNGYIKLFNEKALKNDNYDNHLFFIKISGVWENEYEYGLTYKFYVDKS